MVLAIILIIILLLVLFFFVGKAPRADRITWGMNFSQKQAEGLGLDWKSVYLAIIEDLGAKKIKLGTYWDAIEKNQGEYDFEDLDWQVKTAEEKGANLMMVVGMKSPRWPECHVPEWTLGLSKEEQQEKILGFLEKMILRYRDSSAITAWQVENEPFFKFGECLWTDKDFLKKEVALVKSLDLKHRPVLISDSGEGSLWISSARIGDIAGTTMYRKVWFKELKSYLNYPFPPVFYWRKAELVKKLFGKEVICVELQAEPWCPKQIFNCSLEEQQKTMSLEQFKKNMDFARDTGLKEFYLWGGEWMYWMKEKQGNSDVWLEAKKLFLE